MTKKNLGGNTSASRSRLPQVSAWVPKRHPAETIDSAFYRRCHQIEREILSRVAYEKKFNEHAFDSGWTVEEIIRLSLHEVLPRRYAVQAASVSDSKGYTAGDCDVVVFNNLWFPVIKAGPTPESRRVYLPIEGVYAVLEVKQSLTAKSLDDAMRKLVVCHRLFRPSAPYDRLVENDQRTGCTHYISNPLFSAIIAAGLDPGWTRDEAVERFIRINQILPRTDVVRALCILGQGTILWAYPRDPSSDLTRPEDLAPATFMTEDRYAELVPVYAQTDPDDSPLYELMHTLLAHLFGSVLAPDNLAVHYGLGKKVRVPSSGGATLLPDPKLQKFLDEPCVGRDTSVDSAYHGHPPPQA
jgi:hypothetical protein